MKLADRVGVGGWGIHIQVYLLMYTYVYIYNIYHIYMIYMHIYLGGGFKLFLFSP